MASLTITLIQSVLHWEDKKANLQLFEDKINSIQQRTEIIILPEMFSTGFSMKPEVLAEKMDGQTIEWLKAMAAKKKAIITGSVIIEEEGYYYNRLVWVLPNGQLGIYDKRHLFGFAKEDEHYSPGNRRLIASVNGWKINLQICYDLRFPVWARQSWPLVEGVADGSADSVQSEYDVLIYVANWPERRNHAWKTLLTARAIENQSYVIGVNRVGKDGNAIYYSGDSLVIDPLGEIIYHKEHEEDIFTITLNKESLEEIRTNFPFWKDRDQFFIQ